MFFSKSGGHKYVDRGEPLSADFSVGSFVKNNTWVNLDLSTIIPTNAKLVLLRLAVTADEVSSLAMFRKEGGVGEKNADSLYTQAAMTAISATILVTCNTSGIIQYKFTPTTWYLIELTVGGWFV